MLCACVVRRHLSLGDKCAKGPRCILMACVGVYVCVCPCACVRVPPRSAKTSDARSVHAKVCMCVCALAFPSRTSAVGEYVGRDVGACVGDVVGCDVGSPGIELVRAMCVCACLRVHTHVYVCVCVRVHLCACISSMHALFPITSPHFAHAGTDAHMGSAILRFRQ